MPIEPRRRLRKRTPQLNLLLLNCPLDKAGISTSLLFSLKKLGIKNLAELHQKLEQNQIETSAIGALGWKEINRIFKTPKK